MRSVEEDFSIRKILDYKTFLTNGHIPWEILLEHAHAISRTEKGQENLPLALEELMKSLTIGLTEGCGIVRTHLVPLSQIPRGHIKRFEPGIIHKLAYTYSTRNTPHLFMREPNGQKTSFRDHQIILSQYATSLFYRNKVAYEGRISPTSSTTQALAHLADTFGHGLDQ